MKGQNWYRWWAPAKIKEETDRAEKDRLARLEVTVPWPWPNEIPSKWGWCTAFFIEDDRWAWGNPVGSGYGAPLIGLESAQYRAEFCRQKGSQFVVRCVPAVVFLGEDGRNVFVPVCRLDARLRQEQADLSSTLARVIETLFYRWDVGRGVYALGSDRARTLGKLGQTPPAPRMMKAIYHGSTERMTWRGEPYPAWLGVNSKELLALDNRIRDLAKSGRSGQEQD